MKVVAMILAAALASGCVAPMYSTHPLSRGHRYAPLDAAAGAEAAIGRWDNVMMLAPGTRVHVLKMDGGRVEGPLVAASATHLRMSVASGEVELAAADVARIDRLGQAGQRMRDAASGAAHGVGAVGLLGLIAGRMPPARLFAAGAIAGAELGVHARDGISLSTVYVSPDIVRRR